jgi:hypothetical protein
MNLLVKDYDQIGQNEVLGCVAVPPAVLYKAKGERMEFKLQTAPGAIHTDTPGFLAVRCRRATDYDKKFMENYIESKDAVAPVMHTMTGNSNLRSIITRNQRVEKDGTKKVGFLVSDL